MYSYDQMIAFSDDVIKRNVHTHVETRNRTFVRMSFVLRKMGIKNNAFFLALYDRRLIHVNPRSPNLTPEIKAAVVAECKRNIWYYFREVCYIPESGGSGTQFDLHRGNLAMIWCFVLGIDYTSTQPRQTGKSIAALALASYVLFIHGENFEWSMFTHSTKLVQSNVGRVKGIRDLLPAYMLERQVRDEDNKQGLSYVALGNRYRTYIGQEDARAADNIGRGETTPAVHVDEGCFTANLKISYPVLMAATVTARENALKNGQFHSNLYTTTAGRTDSESGAFMYEIVSKALPFAERLYDCDNREAVLEIVKKGSTNLTINGTFSYLQLGKDHAWFHQATSRANMSQDDIDRDYLNIWKSGLNNSILSTVLLSRLKAARVEPHHVELFHNFLINWYVPESVVRDPRFMATKFVIGMDSSDLVNRDFTALVMIDPRDLRVIATFRCNEANLAMLGVFIAEFLLRFEKALFVPEAKSSARGLMDAVLLKMRDAGVSPLTRIFNKIVDNYGDPAWNKYDIRTKALDDAHRKHLGFMTTGTTRETLFKSVLVRAVTMAAEKTYDSTLINELSGLTVKNGRVDHRHDAHDDTAVAYLLACYALFEGKNLQFYGLAPTDVMIGVTPTGEAVDIREQTRQAALKKQLKELEHLHGQSAHNPVLKSFFEQKIAALQTLIGEQVMTDPPNLDALHTDPSSYTSPLGVTPPPPPPMTLERISFHLNLM